MTDLPSGPVSFQLLPFCSPTTFKTRSQCFPTEGSSLSFWVNLVDVLWVLSLLGPCFILCLSTKSP